MPVKPKVLYNNTCEYIHCKKKFRTSNYKRKYCSFECSENAQGGAERHNGRMEKDPTEEEIADICRKILSGEIVIQSAKERPEARRVRREPNWVLAKKLK